MAEMFAGDWTVGILELTGNASQRFIIEGSLASDGVYQGTTTSAPVSVSGTSWSIRLEAFSPIAPKGWGPAHDVRRIRASYTLHDGLDVFLRAYSVFGLSSRIGQNEYFSECVLICRNVDPKLNPWQPFTNPYDFTLPKRKRPRPKEPIRPPRQPD